MEVGESAMIAIETVCTHIHTLHIRTSGGGTYSVSVTEVLNSICYFGSGPALPRVTCRTVVLLDRYRRTHIHTYSSTVDPAM